MDSNQDTLPQKGFYYHFKHDDTKGVQDMAYEVIGAAKNTEDESISVLYRPLYVCDVYQNGKLSFSRPVGMFNDNVDKNGYIGPRFNRITDQALIQKLESICDGMYSK